MKLVIIAVCFLFINNCFCKFHHIKHYNVHHNKKQITKRLLNSTQIAIEKAPFMAVVEADKSFPNSHPFSTAVIISNLFLLSTSEFFSLQQGKEMRAYIGLSNINLAKPDDIYEVENVTIKLPRNDSYSSGIALIRLKKEIAFNYRHRPIALFAMNEVIMDQITEFTLMGYGYSQRNRENSLGILSRKTMRLNTRDIELSNAYFSISTNLQMCPGDQGDPLIVKNKLIGFAIYPNSCDANSQNLTIFTGVKRLYNWIKLTVGKKNFTQAIKRAYPKTSSNLFLHFT
ncbi:kallikrein-8-like [Leptopilina heterotoma]|uniref:kallikrein-8-like n=1 Tax=Leptopilina heterotoma TaxID=63436 RepID=UPI001CA86D2D|nr:kallikrein-8-like [Leptopilina heterotoma]